MLTATHRSATVRTSRRERLQRIGTTLPSKAGRVVLWYDYERNPLIKRMVFVNNELVKQTEKKYPLVWTCERDGVSYFDTDRGRMTRLITGHLGAEHGVPVGTLDVLLALSYDDSIIAFSERERLLCEAMFWVKSGSSYPVGVGNLDAFLEELVLAARRLWSAKDQYKSELEIVRNVMKDEIDMLRRAQ